MGEKAIIRIIKHMHKDTIQKRSAGGIVHNNGKFLVVNALDYNQIILPKGTIEAGETPEQTAVREVLEETGYRVKIKAPLGEISYEFDEDDGKHYKKTVYHFLLELIDEDEVPVPIHQEDENFENLWLTEDEALERLTHDDSKDLLKKAIRVLRSN